MSSSPPKKYTKINGVMKINPEYKKWKDAQDGGATPSSSMVSPQALPIVSSMQDHEELNEIVVNGGGKEWALSESTNDTIEMMQEPEISLAAGMTPDGMVDQLGAILNKYEVPMGLMNKLMMLSEFQSLEFIIDDSGSMSMLSDTIDIQTKQPQTRWQEASSRLKEMVEVLAYVPFNKIDICFLNRPDRVVLERGGRDPKTFLADAYARIDTAFRSGPMGCTPVLEKLQDSMIRGQGSSISRYIFGDGIPNGGQQAQTEILNICMNRTDPASNPITFISVTNEDAVGASSENMLVFCHSLHFLIIIVMHTLVEWMKDVEEAAPYCSEADDYQDEAREVLRDHGAGLPFSKGFHLICQLVAAMNPDDLDAMDESVPFTKTTLDNLLGVQHNEESYRHYFNCFQEAQHMRTVEGKSDQFKKHFKWEYQEFLRAPMARDIPQVCEFKAHLKTLG